MKHILNNISEEEKKAIREQHTGGMKLNNEKFKKLVETKQGDSKPFVSEQIQDRIVPSGPSPSAKPNVVKDKITSPSSMTKPTSPSPYSNNIVPCSKLGIKSLGSCDSKTKRPIDYCSALGVKTPGYCYIDTKQPMVENKLGNVKPYLNESAEQMQANQMAQDLLDQVKSGEKTPDPSLKQGIVDCIKKGSYRHLSVVTLGAGTEILGALALLFASGVGTLPAMVMVFTGAAIVAIEGLLTGKDSGAGGVGEEIKQLQACLKASGKIK
jgi:hypothetical protein